jgi:uncharacterized membrane protein
MNGNTFFVVNLLATWYMVGLIWMVQIVHYNMFDRVGQNEFAKYEADHNRLITPIVAIPMLAEVATACLLLTASPVAFPRWAAWVGLGLIALIWLSTMLLQVPMHGRLMDGFDESAYRKLVSTNWIRTILWTVRGLMLGYFALQMLPKE